MVLLCSSATTTTTILLLTIILIASNMCKVSSVKSSSKDILREEHDNVNVISIENMDALLRLRLGENGPSYNNENDNNVDLIKTTRFLGKRQRRAHAPLCENSQCLCKNYLQKWINVTCFFKGSETLEILSGDLPENTLELRIENLNGIHLLQNAFYEMPGLNFVMINRVNQIIINSEAFRSLKSPSFFLRIQNCNMLELEERSFRLMEGAVDITIDGCSQVILGRNVFSWLSHFELSNVLKLVLVSNSFSIEFDKRSEHGPTTSIDFRNVTIDTIPNLTFRASAAKVGFTECRIQMISSGAFTAMEISRVYFEHSEIRLLETGAFSDFTLIYNMDFIGVVIDVVRPYAFSTVVNVTLKNSRINQVYPGAFNLTAARVHFIQNYFGKLHNNAVEVVKWNEVIFTRNQFERLEADALVFPFQEIPGVTTHTFEFTENEILEVGVAGLRFLSFDSVEITIEGNRFSAPCSCRLEAWTQSLVDGHATAELIYNSSSCAITDWLGSCFSLSTGHMSMSGYTRAVCGTNPEVTCDDTSRRWVNDSLDWDVYVLLAREKKFLSVVVLTVICSVVFLFAVMIVTWMKRSGFIGRLLSQCRSSSVIASASISRLNLHEYAEIQNLRNQVVTEDEDHHHNHIEEVFVDDKSTQTLPEELTQDLLQSLREKLDDPENYREAREMIEHLYDLIKVEEVEQENPYAEVRSRTRTRCGRGGITRGISVGTRIPSLDKLAPIAYETRRFHHNHPAAVLTNDYAEPRDRRDESSSSAHVYCELPGQPDVVMMLANRPLPNRPDDNDEVDDDDMNMHA